jgi:hypothetical protein
LLHKTGPFLSAANEREKIFADQQLVPPLLAFHSGYTVTGAYSKGKIYINWKIGVWQGASWRLTGLP